jgi:hypothetical protein
VLVKADSRYRLIPATLLAAFLCLAAVSRAQTAPADQPSGQVTHRAVPSHQPVVGGPRSSLSSECDACIRANLEYLAGPKLHGRGSGTEDEHRAAEFIAAKLKEYGLVAAAENGDYIQTGTSRSRTVTAQPTLSFDVNEAAKPRAINWENGNEISIFHLTEAEVSGPLQKLDLTDGTSSPTSVKNGSVLLLKLKPDTKLSDARAIVEPYVVGKAVMLIIPEPPDGAAMFEPSKKQMPRLPLQIGDQSSPDNASVVVAKTENFNQLWAMQNGTVVKLHAEVSPWQTRHTWNVLAKLEGTAEPDQIILLSAHLDHLGVKNGSTYYGADDDASGTVAVMELARALAKAPKLHRSVVFALWGSEEAGMVGARYFLEHPTLELKNIIANLEFEMIARPDPKLKPDELWLTGWERTNLGPELAAHGAKLVADARPEQGFFTRSDNFVLAKKGIVAQTASSYGLHKDYHQPTDNLAGVDWLHLDQAIGSLIAPVLWLADSDFTPTWNQGKKP